MRLEEQVCSLELSKQLKILGVKQESIVWWTGPESMERPLVYIGPQENAEKLSNHGVVYSAFTVAELGEMLPRLANVNGMQGWLCHKEEDLKWHIQYRYNINTLHEADTEADARAKMLVYLLENKLITL